jgi:3-methyladenine DNA glycosylase AlkC
MRDTVQIVRLDARELGAVIPFEKAKDGILKQMRDIYVEDKAGNMLNAIRKDPDVVVNEQAVDKLVTRVPPELIKQLMRETAEQRARAAQKDGAGQAPAVAQ